MHRGILPYRLLPDIALADIAYEAESTTLNGLFETCGRAMTDIMVDRKGLRTGVSRKISISGEGLDRLLYDFLTELIIIKDVDSLLFRDLTLDVREDGSAMSGSLDGEAIDRERHVLRNDVKAVTMHMFGVKREGKHWKATVVLDI